MNTVGFLVCPEQWVWDWNLDDLYGSALGIWCAGQPVVGVQAYLMLHDTQDRQTSAQG